MNQNYPERLSIRVPKGTKERIRKKVGKHNQSDFGREAILEKLSKKIKVFY